VFANNSHQIENKLCTKYKGLSEPVGKTEGTPPRIHLMGPGLLKFKGDTKKKKKRKIKHDSSSTAAAKPNFKSGANPGANPGTPTQQKGSGQITSSTTTVMGHDTKFTSELSIGDAILVVRNSKPEMRIVKMVLSSVSIGISSAFSEDCKTPTDFSFINRPKAVDDAEVMARKETQSRNDAMDKASGAGAGGTMTYRVKKAGGAGNYEVIKEKIDSDMSREDMLAKRSSKKSDRYC